VASTAASLALVLIIPITLFPSGGERFLTIDMTLPPGTSIETTLTEVGEIEGKLSELAGRGEVDAYLTTIGTPESGFTPGGPSGQGGASRANILVRLTGDAPENIAEGLRETFSSDGPRQVAVAEIGNGPPSSGLEVAVTGSDYGAISDATRELVTEFAKIDGMVNVTSDVAESRDEVVIRVSPPLAAAVGLSARAVAFQVSQFMVGSAVTQLHLGDTTLDVVLRGRPEDADRIDKLLDLEIAGPMGSARLGDIAEVSLEEGPVSISRFDGRRSANITGAITAEDTQSMGRLVQQRIDAMDLPDGVEVAAGGIFADVAEGFRDIGLAMGVGVLLVYLVMAASLGALRNPFVIVTSLPLAVIGALVALAITGRTLGLPAMMGFLLLVGIVVTNAIVLIAFVEQLRERGLGLHDALVQAGVVRLRPILMTGFTTSFALFPLAAFVSRSGGIIGAELATVVIGGLISSTVLTLVVVPVVYTLMHQSIPGMLRRIFRQGAGSGEPSPAPVGD
jgi:HAE1 family hydrophobic/amphiphilic exporter-1